MRKVGAKPRKSFWKKRGWGPGRWGHGGGPNLEKVGAQRADGGGPVEGRMGPNPEKIGTGGWGVRRAGASNFGLFFPFPSQMSFLLPYVVNLFRGIVASVQAHGPPEVRVSVPWGHVVKLRRPAGRQGSHRMTTQKPKRALWVGHGLEPRPQFQIKRHPEREREEKNEICDGRGEKKTKFRAEGGVQRGAVVRRGGPAQNGAAEVGPAEGRSGKKKQRTRGVLHPKRKMEKKNQKKFKKKTF